MTYMTPVDFNSAWIGSLQYSLTLTPGLIAGRLFDLGYLHVPLAFFSGLLVVSTILVAECKVFAEFLVVQGLLTGVCLWPAPETPVNLIFGFRLPPVLYLDLLWELLLIGVRPTSTVRCPLRLSELSIQSKENEVVLLDSLRLVSSVS